jgi:phage baseplate assembly protein V
LTKFKVGEVVEVIDAEAKVRVKLADQDGMVTKPLPVIQRDTLKDKAYWLPDVGSFVACFLDDRFEDGVVMGAIYSESDRPPVSTREKKHVTFANGEIIEFDRTTGILKIDCTKVEIVCSEESTINGKAIAVIGAGDNDSEANGSDQIVSSGQL